MEKYILEQKRQREKNIQIYKHKKTERERYDSK